MLAEIKETYAVNNSRKTGRQINWVINALSLLNRLAAKQLNR